MLGLADSTTERYAQIDARRTGGPDADISNRDRRRTRRPDRPLYQPGLTRHTYGQYDSKLGHLKVRLRKFVSAEFRVFILEGTS